MLAIADNYTSPIFLANYVKGLIPVNTTLITFWMLYDAEQAIIDYSLVSHSTWIIIDQERKVVFREDNNTEEIMIDIVKEKIEELLYP